MKDLGRLEFHPVVNIACSLFLAGVGIWFLTRLDQEARRIVESRRKWGYAISDYELEVKKWKNRTRLFYLGCTIIFLAVALLSAIPLLR